MLDISYFLLLFSHSAFADYTIRFDEPEEHCYEFTYSDSLNTQNSQICMQYEGDSLWSHNICPQGFHCPDSSFYKLTKETPDVFCIQNSAELPQSTELICPKYVEEFNSCNDFLKCKPGFWCKTDQIDGKCQKRKLLGDSCSNAFECEVDTICNKGSCIEMFSLEIGESADNKVACESAILKDGYCDVPQETAGSHPKYCKYKSDCLSVNDVEGTCLCVPDEDGNSFCGYHLSDFPIKQYYRYLYNGNIALAEFQQVSNSHYPAVQLSNQYYSSILSEVKQYQKLQLRAEECNGYGLSLVLGLLAIILI